MFLYALHMGLEMLLTLALILGIHVIHERGQGHLGVNYHITFLIQVQDYIRTFAAVILITDHITGRITD